MRIKQERAELALGSAGRVAMAVPVPGVTGWGYFRCDVFPLFCILSWLQQNRNPPSVHLWQL